MLSAKFCAEKVLTFGLSSFVWILQKLFGRVFDPEPNVELLAVQLSSGTAAFHDLHFHTDFVNQWLIPYGLEASSGIISKLELKFNELSTLSMSMEAQVIDLKIRRRKASPKPKEDCCSMMDSSVDGEDSVGSGRFQSWLESILRQLVLTVTKLRIEFEGIGVCELNDLKFSQQSNPYLTFAKLYFSLVMNKSSFTSERIFALTDCSVQLDFLTDNQLAIEATVGLVNAQLTPEVLSRIQSLFIRNGVESDDEFEDACSVAETAFFSLDGSDLADSTYAASVDESVFYECLEDQPENSISSNTVQSWLTRGFKLKLKTTKIEVVLSSDLSPNPAASYLVCMQDLAVTATCNFVQEMEVSLQSFSLVDNNHKMESRVDKILTEIPQTLKSLLSNETQNSDRNCGLSFGFPELQEESCLKLKINCKTELSQRKLSVEISTLPVLFSWTPASLLNLRFLLKGFQSMKSQNASTVVGQDFSFDIEWKTGGVYGILEQSGSVLFLELKTGPANEILSSKPSPDRRTFRSFETSEAQTTKLKIAELSLFHCQSINHQIADCRQILFCFSSSPGQENLNLSTGLGCSLEMSSYGPPRSVYHELSTLAYDLFDEYSKHGTESETNDQQERILARVGFEGRCMQSMESFIDLWLENIKLNLKLNDLDTFIELLLKFWKPAQMSDQMKIILHKQSNLLIRIQSMDARLESMSLTVSELEAFLVNGLQNQPISTLAVTVHGLDLIEDQLGSQVKIGAPVQSNLLTAPSIQFFQISELDSRNAKFKQWSVLQNQDTLVCLHERLFEQEWMTQSLIQLLVKNKEKLETDIEVENFCSVFTKKLKMFYKVQDSGIEVCLAGRIERSQWSLQDLKQLKSEFHKVEILIRQNSTSFENLDTVLENSYFSPVLSEKQLKLAVRPTAESEFDCEIKNQECSIALSPDRISGLVQILQFRNSSQSPVFPPCVPQSMNSPPGTSSGMHEIINDAFSVHRSPNDPPRVSSCLTEEDEEIDGFVLVDYPATRPRSEANSPTGTELKCSQASWINDQQQFANENHSTLETEESCLKLPTGYPKSKFIVRLDGLRGEVVIYGEDPEDHVDMSFNGLTIFYYSFKEMKSDYKDRLVALVQDFEIMDCRNLEESNSSSSNLKKPLLERNKAKLKTKFSQKLKQIQRMTNPMIQFVMETVLPDHLSATTDKRLKLTIVPLRLRLSQSLLDFFQIFIQTIPGTKNASVTSCYFQMCEISPVYVVVDYKPTPFNLDRLKSGHTSEILNIVQWGGLEFLLKEIKLSGVTGSENLFFHIFQKWSRDVKSSHRHRMVSGIPSLGILKRMSPATQNIVESSISTLYRKEPAKVNGRGLAMTQSPSLARSATVFGKAVLLEALNAGAHASEGIQSVLTGSQEDTRGIPSDPVSALRKARSTLRDAAKALIEEPIESVRSGEGIKRALLKASQAAPKAMLSPFSALNAIVHGTLRGACDALDTDHVLDS
eukprot:g2898.t1